MGTYTEIKVECDVRADGPALDALRIMFGADDFTEAHAAATAAALCHPLFACPRWRMIGGGCSEYFDTPTASTLESIGDGVWRIRSVSNLKNYHDEIEHFFDWLRPMVVGALGQVIGHKQYEHDQYYDADGPILVVL